MQRAIAAQTALRTGQLTATLDDGNSTRTLTTLRFDFGDDRPGPRMQVTATYQGIADTQSVERVVVGTQMWQRQGGGSWQLIAAQGDVRDQVGAYLPNIDRAPAGEQVEREGADAILRWYDAAHDMDVSVVIDAVTGNPRRMTERIRASGAILTVIYDAWNIPIAIAAP